MSDPQRPQPEPPPAPVRFGPEGCFEVQPAERRLLVRGQPVALGGRAFDVLVALIARAGELVSKDELLDRVWPGLVVEEANLQMQVSNLRKVLGADAIVTVPGHGYRFVAPVVAPAPSAPAPENVPLHLPPNAPQRRTQRLFGRDADLARLEALLPEAGCVTVVGPAGVGKTSLARAAAARAAGRSVWVDLAPLTQAEQLPGALARALNAPLAPGEAAPQLLRALQGQTLLIVLDNAEHLVQASADLAVLLGTRPGVRLLVTSQLPLGVAGEHVQRLGPLALPPALPPARATAEAAEPGAAVPDDGALALLVARIVAADDRFTCTAQSLVMLGEICAQLDGLPLALEMAAARVPLMGVQGVRDALSQRFALLTRGHREAAARHRTLHNALDWSYRLLSLDEQRLFRALGVFAGGFTLELAVAVAADEGEGAEHNDSNSSGGSSARWQVIDGLAALADRSLLSVSADEPPRYRLLDSMRAFALQSMALIPGEREALRRRHARALTDLFCAYNPADASTRARCLADMENAREALHWAREHDLARAAQLTVAAASMSTFDVWRNECTQWLRSLHAAIAAPAGQQLPAELQARWWTEMARTAIFIGDAQASTAARYALALWRPLQQPSKAFFAAVVWVRAVTQPGDELDAACAALQAQAAALPAASLRERLWLHGAMATASVARNDHAAALEWRWAELPLAQELGAEELIETVECNIANSLNRLLRYAEAAVCAQALLTRIDSRNGDANANMPWVLVCLIEALVGTGRLDEARALVPRACACTRRYATPTVLPVLPWLAAAQGRFEAAARLIGHVRQRFEAYGITPDAGDEFLLGQAQRAVAAALDAALVPGLMRQGRALDEDAAAALAAA